MKRLVDFVIRIPFKLALWPFIFLRIVIVVKVEWGNGERVINRAMDVVELSDEKITNMLNWLSFGAYERIFYPAPNYVKELQKTLGGGHTKKELTEFLKLAIEDEDYEVARSIQNLIDAQEQLEVLKNKKL